jgi:hypothetical protein
MNFPLDVWGVVLEQRPGKQIEKLKIVTSEPDCFLMITVEEGREYDVWMETAEDVEAAVRALKVDWQIDK